MLLALVLGCTRVTAAAGVIAAAAVGVTTTVRGFGSLNREYTLGYTYIYTIQQRKNRVEYICTPTECQDRLDITFFGSHVWNSSHHSEEGSTAQEITRALNFITAHFNKKLSTRSI